MWDTPIIVMRTSTLAPVPTDSCAGNAGGAHKDKGWQAVSSARGTQDLQMVLRHGSLN